MNSSGEDGIMGANDDANGIHYSRFGVIDYRQLKGLAAQHQN